MLVAKTFAIVLAVSSFIGIGLLVSATPSSAESKYERCMKLCGMARHNCHNKCTRR